LKFQAEGIFSLLGQDEDASACTDICESACKSQPRSFTLQLLAQVASKMADTLGSSRVVLPWLLGAIGAPAFFIAWLVPIRESLSLLPQLAIAARLRERPRRKHVYVLGAIVQGICLLLMPVSLVLNSASFSAATILVLLALFSLARGLCSVASKDVLGKTVAKGRRGRLSGLAGSAAGIFTLAFAVFLLLSQGATTRPLLVAMLITAGTLWLVAALLYAQVPEEAGATEGGASAWKNALRSIRLLQSDAPLRAFIFARMLLVSSAYAIPFLVIRIFDTSSGSALALAIVMLAEGLAALSSGAIWGLFADRAAQRVMAAAGGLTVLTLGAVLLGPAHFISHDPGGLIGGFTLYLAAVAHQGVRIGRKTYLVDLANAENRASYVAISNTVIGVFVLAGGGLGWIAQRFGYETVLACLLGMALLGTLASWRLKAN
jgi:MFS family permease